MRQEENRYSILDELSKCSGYDIALMTTFNFELGFFERALLNRLYSKDVRKISLFVDAKELTTALQEFDILHNGSNIGCKYMVNPVQMNGSFHPKVILLLGEKKARLFVGSANIKTSGYATNNEIFNFIDYSLEKPENLDVIVSAIDFFQEINKVSYMLDNVVLNEAKEMVYYRKMNSDNELYLFHNMKTSILNQVSENIIDEVVDIRIAVPYYDKELSALKAIKDAFPKATLHLYIQNEHSTFPVDYNDRNQIVNKISVFTGFKDNESSSSNNFYHGKVFLFKTKYSAYVLYGSTNCTQAAITKSFNDGGNIECDFFEKGSYTEYDYFFENMNEAVGVKLVSQSMVYESSNSVIFNFKYGEENGDVVLHISYARRIDIIKVNLGDKELGYQFYENELRVIIPEEYRENLSDIFEIAILYENKEAILRCWTYNSVMLANNREKQSSRNELSDFDIDSTGDKYLEDRMKFLKAEATCLSEWQEYKKNQKYMNQIKLEQEGADGEAEEFIIDFQIPDEYRYAYKQYNAVSKIRSMFIRRFLGISVIGEFGKSEECSIKKYSVDKERNIESRNYRKATSAEKSFERFVKGKVKGMLSDVYVEVVELEHYIGLAQVVMEIFDKYNDDECVEDIFVPNYVISTKVSFLIKILNKFLEEHQDKVELQEALIKKCFRTILENYAYYRNIQETEPRFQYELLNRNFLQTLEKQFSLRQSYNKYIKELLSANNEDGLMIGYELSCQYIEELYGYKNFDMLCGFISEKYENARIESQGRSLYVYAESCNIREHNRPNLDVLREIGRYSRNVFKITNIVISVKNIVPNPENRNLVATIKHTISVEYHQWRSEETRMNGEVYDSKKSQFISF